MKNLRQQPNTDWCVDMYG